jgi:hypothetical protein
VLVLVSVPVALALQFLEGLSFLFCSSHLFPTSVFRSRRKDHHGDLRVLNLNPARRTANMPL